MEEIGLPQYSATTLYEDNQGAILMAQAGKPTKRTRHVDLKVFALQDWVEHDLILVKRIDTIDNYSDAMTKATHDLWCKWKDKFIGINTHKSIW